MGRLACACGGAWSEERNGSSTSSSFLPLGRTGWARETFDRDWLLCLPASACLCVCVCAHNHASMVGNIDQGKKRFVQSIVYPQHLLFTFGSIFRYTLPVQTWVLTLLKFFSDFHMNKELVVSLHWRKGKQQFSPSFITSGTVLVCAGVVRSWDHLVSL